MDVGLDQEIEGLLSFGSDESLEFGESVFGAAVESGQDGHHFELFLVFSEDLGLFLD